MTLKELLSTNNLSLDLYEELENKTVEIVYYWYHHMIQNDMRRDIQDALDVGDYDLFVFYQQILNKPDICYLPDYASVYCDGNYIGKVWITPLTINLLTHSECECG